MKVVKITKRSSELRKLLESADREDIVVETPEGDLFLISAVDEFAYEIAQQRKNKKLMAFLDKRFRAARQEKGIPLEEVNRRLGLDSNGRKNSRRKTGSHSR
jgi:hypothetical protein